MEKIYTQQDLILYAYNETELTDSVLIQNSIDGDPLIEGEFREIVESIHMLDKIKLEPDEKVMTRLVQFMEWPKLQ